MGSSQRNIYICTKEERSMMTLFRGLKGVTSGNVSWSLTFQFHSIYRMAILYWAQCLVSSQLQNKSIRKYIGMDPLSGEFQISTSSDLTNAMKYKIKSIRGLWLCVIIRLQFFPKSRSTGCECLRAHKNNDVPYVCQYSIQLKSTKTWLMLYRQ